MPQGVVIAVRQGVGGVAPKPDCHGEVIAIEDDPKIGITRWMVYTFVRGSGNCCNKQKGEEVEIVTLLPDGTVIVQCS
ncbi:hypothetical protein [Rufibacter tibetensis]|uniref:Uncharacterized protein n=1 Tax=Rufibacter tibetensis TaxID=512763 RepID=A0A0P0C6H8_9BACT|nr:hypothetical protein [Rufibacter tibetensis]ALI98931.1 hypothetical protein DC20_08005 [Rufibacter tibetensis]